MEILGMSDHSNLSEAWIAKPPVDLVVGGGTYALTLTLVLGAARLEADKLMTGPVPNEHGGYSPVLGDLRRVFLIARVSHSAGDLLRVHDALWRWVEKLSPDGDQHELAILFVGPPATAVDLGIALSAGLGLQRIGKGTPGHGLVTMDNGLNELLAAADLVQPQDLPPLRSRQRADARYAALKTLRDAATNEDAISAAKTVSEAFRGCEYLLDLFCRLPSHQNGNRLRNWLNTVVTGQVPPYDAADADRSPSDWLADDHFS